MNFSEYCEYCEYNQSYIPLGFQHIYITPEHCFCISFLSFQNFFCIFFFRDIIDIFAHHMTEFKISIFNYIYSRMKSTHTTLIFQTRLTTKHIFQNTIQLQIFCVSKHPSIFKAIYQIYTTTIYHIYIQTI